VGRWDLSLIAGTLEHLVMGSRNNTAKHFQFRLRAEQTCMKEGHQGLNLKKYISQQAFEEFP
jgi:hypothetical protein